MQCKKFKNSLAGFVEKSLSPNLTSEMTAHMESCPACSRLEAKFSCLWAALETPERFELSPSFQTKVKARIIAFEEGKRPAPDWMKGALLWTRRAIVIALLLLCIFLGYGLGNLPELENQAASLDERAIATKQFFGSSYPNPLENFSPDSVEATWIKVIAGEREVDGL